jgi:hypothetical protein
MDVFLHTMLKKYASVRKNYIKDIPSGYFSVIYGHLRYRECIT